MYAAGWVVCQLRREAVHFDHLRLTDVVGFQQHLQPRALCCGDVGCEVLAMVQHMHSLRQIVPTLELLPQVSHLHMHSQSIWSVLTAADNQQWV